MLEKYCPVIAKGSIVNADEANAWNALHGKFEMRRINHEEAYSMDGGCTNDAESYSSRLRRAEIGHHHLWRAFTCFAMRMYGCGVFAFGATIAPCLSNSTAPALHIASMRSPSYRRLRVLWLGLLLATILEEVNFSDGASPAHNVVQP